MLERRGFVAKLTMAIAGLIATALAIPLAGYTVFPAFRRRADLWVNAGSAAGLVPERPRELKVFYTVQDGWLQTTVSKSVWAVKQVSGEVVVFSGLCTHLGCGFRWDPERGVFLCPCHQGLYGPDGRVLGGPPPRPLDRLPAKVEDGQLLVIYKEFRAGASSKLEL